MTKTVVLPTMINLVLRGLSGGLLVILLSSCGLVTKPVGIATGIVVKPVKIVTDASVDLLRKPTREAIRLVKPRTWLPGGRR